MYWDTAEGSRDVFKPTETQLICLHLCKVLTFRVIVGSEGQCQNAVLNSVTADRKVLPLGEAFAASLTNSCLITTVDVIVLLQLMQSCRQIEHSSKEGTCSSLFLLIKCFFPPCCS